MYVGKNNLSRPRSKASAFTLLETLVVMGIISMLLALLMSGLTKARQTMKKLKCASNMRTVALDFQFFAEGNAEQGQGDSERLGKKRFYMNDFQESLYGLDEFWNLGHTSTGMLNSQKAPMLCPAGAPQLIKHAGFPCSRQAVGPGADVSLAFNMRLYRGVVSFKGKARLAPVRLTRVRTEVLDHPYVPLVMDVDGRAAAARGVEPYYTAPPRSGVVDPYTGGKYWMPSGRHHGNTNVAFVGGHVLSSDHPEKEHWNWSYQANVGR